MQESVIYRDILQQGLEAGRQRGLQEGQQAEVLTLVMRLLTRQLGPVEPRLQLKVQELSQIQRENLAAALLDFSEMADWVGCLEQEDLRAIKPNWHKFMD